MQHLSDGEREELKRKLAEYHEYHVKRVNVLHADDYASSALLYSIISLFFFGFVLGPIAIIKGARSLGLIKQAPSTQGRGKAIAGIIIGSISTFFNILVLLFFLNQLL